MDHLSGFPGYKTLRPTGLPTFRVYYNDGSSYLTSMAVGVTLAQARSYFLTGDTTVVGEDEITGQEKTLTRVRVEQE